MPAIISTLRQDVLPLFAPRELQHIIIYCEQRNQVDQLVSVLNASLGLACATGYHSNMTLNNQEASLSKWKAGKFSVMVATSGLMMGLHVPTVRLVIIVGMCFGLTYCYQGASRAGRDGQGALVCLIPGSSSPSAGAPDLDICGVQAYSEFIHAQTCRVQALSAFFDGAKPDNVASCSDLGLSVAPCDLCNPSLTQAVKDIVRPSSTHARQPTHTAPTPQHFASFMAQRVPTPGFGLQHTNTRPSHAPPPSSSQSLYAPHDPSPPFTMRHVSTGPSTGSQSIPSSAHFQPDAHSTPRGQHSQSTSHPRHVTSTSQLGSQWEPTTPTTRDRSNSTMENVPNAKRRRHGDGTLSIAATSTTC
jgi:hypothetical protein